MGWWKTIAQGSQAVKNVNDVTSPGFKVTDLGYKEVDVRETHVLPVPVNSRDTRVPSVPSFENYYTETFYDGFSDLKEASDVSLSFSATSDINEGSTCDGCESRTGSHRPPILDSPRTQVMCFILEKGVRTGLSAYTSDDPEDVDRLVVADLPASSVLRTACCGKQGLHLGYSILRVNSSTSRSEMVREVVRVEQEGGALEMAVKPRPPYIEYTVKRQTEGQRIGVIVGIDGRCPNRLFVHSVNRDELQRSTQCGGERYQVFPNDVIASLGTSNLPPEALVDKITALWAAGEEITLGILTSPFAFNSKLRIVEM